MERLTVLDKKIEGGLQRAVIDERKVREFSMTIYWALKRYEDTGLTPEQILELKEAVQRLYKIFGDEITVNQVIDFFVDFYIAQGDPGRVEAAELLTNEEVAKYRELKKRDTAQAPEEIQDTFGDTRLICTNCRNSVINYFNRSRPPQFCMICGQRLKWEE